jgi:probable F420-dependent oxidoreductase
MRIGAVFPQTEFGHDPAALRDYAQTAEALGYSHILAYDHVLGAHPNQLKGWAPYTYKDQFLEPFTLFSYWAGLTEKIEFTSGVIILPQRQTALVAKQAAMLQVLSGGRLRLGVGLGWNAVEYTALGEDFGNRGRRIEEQVALLRRLWSEELVDFEGRWHRIPQAGINPRPTQPIPIWFGGHHPNVLRRVAQLGDGWLPNYRSAEDAAEPLGALDVELEQIGRSRADIGIEARLMYKDGEAVWSERRAGWQAAGATHMSINTMGADSDGPQGHIKAIKDFARLLN